MAESEYLVAFVGNPNSGKTTIFNSLTGENQRVGNFSGVTVDVKVGETFTPHGIRLKVMDLPGCYSLQASSPDEQAAIDVLRGEAGTTADLGRGPDLVVCVVDASNLERHLRLALQVIELGLPCIVALNMVDVAEKAGLRLDPATLSEELGVPVVPMQANGGKGILDLKQAMRLPFPPPSEAAWKGHTTDGEKADVLRQAFIRQTCDLVARRPDSENQTITDKLDRVLLHPISGWIAFLSVMFGVFWAIFSLAGIPMGWIEFAIGAIGSFIEGAMEAGDLRSLIVDGLIGGVGGVLVFLPQIILLFLFIGLLESSGYMARAAFLMDGVMAKAGLSGKSFLPYFSSYACAIPGVMATRTIDSAKERLVTIFVAPWASCSARLPVYFLIIPLLLHESEGSWKQAAMLFGIYALGTLSAFVVARLLRGRLGADEVKNHFMLELPLYRVPQWNYILRHVLERSWAFVSKAGTIILALSILLWALSTYPKSDSEDPSEALSNSAMGRIGDLIEPVVKPLGFDGRMGTAILTSFAAREVFVSSTAILFRVEEGDDDAETADTLRQRIAAARWPDGRPLFTPLSLISLLVFFIYALQCLPTSAVVAKESGSWKWAVGQFVFMTAFAYFASLLVYQGGLLLGF